MNPPIDKELYRSILISYFHAFGTGDFSKVQFSQRIQFLSPISGITMKGQEAVINFVSGVSTRVKRVEIISTAVDYPTASGVWQMTITRPDAAGQEVTYTLHNFFRLDEEGLAYIWPMFDPKMVIMNPDGLLQWLTGKGYYEVAAQVHQQPTGVALSRNNRLFINFPRWVDNPMPSVGEVRADGTLAPFPDVEMNEWDGQPGPSAGSHFVCVHTLYADREDQLWILDPASPQQKAVVPGGAKLVKVNLSNNTVDRIYHFPEEIAPRDSYLNKIRLAQGFAFITDSKLGAIVVLDLNTGSARRVLEQHVSTLGEPGVDIVIDGVKIPFSPVHVDGIALDPSGTCIYYKALTGRTIYRIRVSDLLDKTLSADEVGSRVEIVAISEPTGGIEFDSAGNLYLTAVQEDAIKVLRPNGEIKFLARATNFIWPDTIAIGNDGDLFFAASQLNLMPSHTMDGTDQRTPPYNVFRLKLS